MTREQIIKVLTAYSFRHHHEGIILSENNFDDVAEEILTPTEL
jgi:hypothetical protein